MARLRCLALSALAVLSCLQLQAIIPAASQSQLVVEAAGGGHRQQAAAEDVGRASPRLRRTCAYTVKVKTSCASPRRSSDAVSLAFGDAYRDEVYVAQLAPRSGFERCATDTFRVSGPCVYDGVCYLYLRRAGARRGGWTPEWVAVYEPAPSTFYYGDALPAGVWYGFNRCPRREKADPADDDDASVAKVQSM